ncbi:PASTA domain-containing protein [Micromonospora phaseoli]|uniref:PASTA domain-containing protein n=1 Tax=Micromonospora phaseoli TaxID=1144548 RepID=A0A1H7BMV9_9ACTN|nr:PASTA domain-containing protein [Micromonospora phaseoli]SEJ75892.1 PASTA domain-containing protein [Micromonospora phaseoli]
MSDDRQEPAERQPDDQTRPISPAGGTSDETAPLGRTPDETAPLGRTPDETAPLGRTPDETAPADATAPLPPTQRSGPTAWAGRAEVPSVRPGADPEQTSGEWYPEEQADRPWWLPILWGIVVLILLGLLGVGIWLARQALDEGGSTSESPQPTTPAATSASPSPTTPSPSPSPSPTSAAPVQLPVPPLVGLSEAAARALLDQLDLDHQVEYRPSDQPPGTVIATDPEAGELVEAGDEIRLVIASASPSPSVTTAEPTSEPTTTASPND